MDGPYIVFIYCFNFSVYNMLTGASGGIGASTAILFSRLGAQLSLIGRNETNLLKVKAECAKQQGASEVC